MCVQVFDLSSIGHTVEISVNAFNYHFGYAPCLIVILRVSTIGRAREIVRQWKIYVSWLWRHVGLKSMYAEGFTERKRRNLKVFRRGGTPSVSICFYNLWY
jgi:hypothetical protein